MNTSRSVIQLLLFVAPMLATAQKAGRLPDVSSTLKGNLILPVPLGIPLFESVTESVGQLDGVVQFPLYNGLGVGVGGKMTWFTINERALAPIVTSGEIRRSAIYGKVQYEHYTGPRTFYELNARFGTSKYTYDCPTCTTATEGNVFHWGAGIGYYLHASDNLAFGLTLGYETDAAVFEATDLGLTGFPGRTEVAESSNYQYLVIGMGFSTRFRKSQSEGPGW